MASKIFSFFNNDGSYPASNDDRLTIEFGKTHLAMLSCSSTGKAKGLEWFSFESSETSDAAPLINEIKLRSALLHNNYASANLYFNNECAVWCPKQALGDQLPQHLVEAVHGAAINSQYQFDAPDNTGMLNVYKVPESPLQQLQSVYAFSSVRHSYTALLQANLALQNLPEQYLQLLVYENDVVITVFAGGKFLLMRSFAYQAPDDVIYHVVNTCRQLNLQTPELVIKVSGFMDTNGALFTHLNRFFNNVSIDSASYNQVVFQTGEHPIHYFTPLFNLAL